MPSLRRPFPVDPHQPNFACGAESQTCGCTALC